MVMALVRYMRGGVLTEEGLLRTRSVFLTIITDVSRPFDMTKLAGGKRYTDSVTIPDAVGFPHYGNRCLARAQHDHLWAVSA